MTDIGMPRSRLFPGPTERIKDLHTLPANSTFDTETCSLHTGSETFRLIGISSRPGTGRQSVRST